MQIYKRLLVLSLAVVVGQSLTAQFRLANVFGDHMVLQRDAAVRIWGFGTPGEDVMVQFAGQACNATVDKAGGWAATLVAMPAEAVGRQLLARSEGATVQLHDVLVGDVWICGGQSNMAWTLRSSRDADMEIDSADSPNIRFLRMPKIARAEPQDDFLKKNEKHLEGNWRSCVPDQVENCTAVGYYFARRLHRRLRVPVAIIDTSWGGTMAQHWCSKETLQQIETVAPYFETYHDKVQAFRDGGGESGAQKRYTDDMAAWESARAQAKADGKREPRRPNKSGYEDPANQPHPGALFNGMIAPLRRLSLKGVVFYQGENNAFVEAWKPFPFTFPAFVRDWRRAFGDGELPVGLVQIAGWSNRRSMTYDMNHHTNIVREVQLDTWSSLENTGLVATYDTNTNQSIHPARKLPVGERVARWALSEVYSVQSRSRKGLLEWRGPLYESMRVVGNKLVVKFASDTARGLRLDRDVDVGFYVAGEDRIFHVARARVLAKTMEVEIWSDQVAMPVAGRYGWSNLPAGGLMNARELPAYPFRTDDWPMEPHQSKGAYMRRKIAGR